MSTNTKHSYKLCVKRATRRRRRTQKRRTSSSIIGHSMEGKCKCWCKSKLSQKLQALKSLIPTHNNNNNNTLKPDQLFKETADYIVLLRTRVLVLHNLIEYYGNNNNNVPENENAVLL
ncbi:hypothetical protein RJT34_28102 [Clitoria ternatea]|uniref:Transcription factor n=1 Tax=Clitoria ternatea TaxID=43366 RepID=A0AAN9F8V7_CLITE